MSQENVELLHLWVWTPFAGATSMRLITLCDPEVKFISLLAAGGGGLGRIAATTASGDWWQRLLDVYPDF